jgi:hypothetical protein
MPDPTTPVVPEPIPAPEPAAAPDPQDELNRKFAERAERGKRQGVTETLEALGVTSIDEAKKAIEEAKRVKQAQMSEADQARAEAEAERTKNAELMRKLAERDTADLRARIVAEAGLKPELAQFVSGTTEDDIRAQVKALIESIPAQSAGVPDPAGNVTPEVPADVALQAQYEEAMKRGDVTAALAIKSQIEAAKNK